MNTQAKIFFNDLNDTQKQTLAAKMLGSHSVRLSTAIVEYILAQDDYENAPFTFEDITNHEYYGVVTINGFEHQLTESERDEKLEFYTYLQGKAQDVFDTLEQKWMNEEDENKTDLLQGRMDKFEPSLDRLNVIVDNLESMDFDDLPEIFQWFSCDSWLIRELESAGECTLDEEFWGRQCCGQSIALDHVIQKIAFDGACEYNCNYLTPEQLEEA